MKRTLEEIRKAAVEKPMLRKMMVEKNSINTEERTVELSISSEYEVDRGWWREILDHKPESIRMQRLSDGASVMDTHYGDQIGVVLKAWIDKSEKKLRALIKFSKSARAEEIWQDILDGIRKNVSIRYQIHEMVIERIVEEVDVYRIVDWEPIHVSMEPDPADPSVGIGRKNEEAAVYPINLEGDIEQQLENFNRENQQGIKFIINQKRGNTSMTPEEKEKLDREKQEAIDRARKEAGEAAALNVQNIYAIARDFQPNVPGIKLMEEADKFVKESKSSDEFRTFVMTKLKDPEALRTPVTKIGMSEKEVRDYSISKVILALADKDFSKLGVEMEASRAVAKALGRDPEGIFIPREAQIRRIPISQRDLVVGTPASGGYTVKDEYIAQSFIELLMNSLISVKAGVTFLPGLKGDIPMTRELSENTFYWVAESAGPAQSDVTFAQQYMRPKQGGARTKLSRLFLMQSALSAESYATSRIVRSCQKGIDRAVFYGTGTDAQPLGIKNVTGIGGVIGTGFNRDKAIDMEALIDAANASDLGTFKWVGKGSTRATLKKKEISQNTAKYLVEDSNKMIDYDFLTSNQIDAGDLFGGIFTDVLVGEWGILDVMANPYGSGYYAGDVEIRAIVAVDNFVNHPGALALATGVN